jgi:hypothetical protein
MFILIWVLIHILRFRINLYICPLHAIFKYPVYKTTPKNSYSIKKAPGPTGPRSPMAKASAKNEIGRRSIGLVEGKISTGNRCSYMFLPSKKWVFL